MGFYSLQIARTGLVASQKALDVTSHNIANANTEGYTRQRLDFSSRQGVTSNKITIGSGVDIDKLTQIRDEYLDYQFRGENSVKNELETKSETTTYIENIFGEPSDHGINQSLSDFFVSMEELTNNAQESSYRETVVQNAVKLTDSIRTVATELTEYQKEINNVIDMSVDQVNSIVERVHDLNKTIYNYELKGTQANDLRDQRNLLIDELSDYIDIEAFEDSNGKLVVNAAGTSVINGTHVKYMEVKSGDFNDYTQEHDNVIYWEGTTSEVKPQSGKLKALLDTRDGDKQGNQGIPYYMDQLNMLAKGMVEEFNAINRAGYTIPYSGNNNISETDINFFEVVDDELTVALKIRVSDKLLDSGYNIALSGDDLGTGNLNWGNSENGIKFIELRDKTDISVDYLDTTDNNIANFEKFYQKTISDMAINKNYFDSRMRSQQELTNFIEGEKLAVSEVSIDEEMINMVQYQQAYNAAAKVISVADQMMETLVNMVR
ncbi:MAG: flagellar hook-associated protein FlgK [Bacillota bacterium]|nr:flagellar hook-associated protein FlgK [Bacillota bacterium]